MRTPEVTFKDSLAVIGTLPSLAPLPTATNICALEIDLVDKLTMISEQSVDFGYSGKVEADVVYALKTRIPWVDWLNPVPHVTLVDNTNHQHSRGVQGEEDGVGQPVQRQQVHHFWPQPRRPTHILKGSGRSRWHPQLYIYV